MASSKILIPIDGSPASMRALDFAIEQLVRSKEDSLVLLHVQNLGSSDYAGASAVIPEFLTDAAAQASAQALNDAVRRCENRAIAYKANSRPGLQVAVTIAEVARAENVSQIVMGTRGLGGFQGLLLGSVANQVIHLAEVPITLIK
jgi:nucleotide-binding universal stress UspA family protein